MAEQLEMGLLKVGDPYNYTAPGNLGDLVIIQKGLEHLFSRKYGFSHRKYYAGLGIPSPLLKYLQDPSNKNQGSEYFGPRDPETRTQGPKALEAVLSRLPS